MEDRWFGICIADMLEATDENDLEAAMVVLRGGTQIERHKEERSGRIWYISSGWEMKGRMAAEIGAPWK